MSQKKNEGIVFPTEIRVVGSYTDRLLSFFPDKYKTKQKNSSLHQRRELSTQNASLLMRTTEN